MASTIQGRDPARVVSTPLDGVPGLDAPVSDIFIEAARRKPGATFIASRSHPAESVTFGAFLEQALRVATALARRGLKHGDKVALISENRPRWCVAHAGILLAGGVAVAIDAQSTDETLAFVVEDSGARFVVASHGLIGRQALHDLPIPRLDLDADWLDLQAHLDDLPRPAGGDRVAALVYTSGTTGSPKGCVLTHSNLRHELHGMRVAGRLAERDVILQFLPLHHVLAQVGTYLGPAAIGMRVVHATLHRAEDLGAALQEGGVTILLAVPQVFHLLHGRLTRPLGLRLAIRACSRIREATGIELGRLLLLPVRRAIGRDLRFLVSGGAALDPLVQRDLLGLGFTVIQAYGLTETAGGAVADVKESPRPGVAGLPLPGVDLRIDEPAADGSGEICLRGNIVTSGYYNRPEESAALLRDGWLRTGDLGRLDLDDRLVIVGRRKEIIVLGNGKNVNPEELEAHYSRSPWIREVCVMAHDPSGGRAEKLHAVVVPDWDRFRREGMGNVREGIRFEIQTLALQRPPAERITSFALRRDPLPRTSTRKLQRYLVEPSGDDPARREPGPPDPRLDSERGRPVAAILRRLAGAEADLRTDAHLELDLGLDSLARMEVALALQSELGIRLEDEEIASAATVGAVLDLVLSGGRARAQGAESAPGSGAPGGSWASTLADAGPQDLPPSIRQGRGAIRVALLRVLLAVARTLGRIAFRLRVEGAQHVPPEGPVLICPNHVSFLDGFLAGLAIPPRVAPRGFVLGEAGYVQHRLTKPLADLVGIVPVDPSRHLRRALRAGAAGLKQGMALLLFPEGERSADGTLQAIRPGAPILSSVLGVPIVPAVITGAFEAWPRGRSLPRPGRVTIRFGPPLDPRRIVPPGTSPLEAQALVADALRRALIELGAPVTPPATGPGAP